MRDDELAMARDLKRWLVAATAACGLVALAYLPPRGDREYRYRREVFTSQLAQQSPARRRAQELAEEWRSAQAALRLAEERQQFHAGAPGPNLLLAGDADAAAQSRLASELDSVWKELGLAETKITVGFVIDLRSATPQAGLPREESWAPSYLLPDSTDRTTCLVRTPVTFYWRRALIEPASAVGREQIRQWLKSSLGPCAFFAAYGAPGKAVRHWLDGRGFDLALYPDWDVATPGRGPRESSRVWMPGRGFWWDYIYHQSRPAVACLAGRIAGCREAVLAAGDDEFRRIVTTDRRFWQQQRLIGGTRFLSDVARELGHDRFLEFWNSSLAADTALAGALRRPVGEWTAEWQQRLVPRISLGPRVPLGPLLLAVLLAAGAVGGIAVTVRRRQVLLLVVALAAFPSAVWAQGNHWERQVRTQLDRTVAALRHSRADGHHVLGIAPLNTDESQTFAVFLNAGQSYDIVAVCDDDCTSLHLRLMTVAGSDLAVDISGENLPALHFTPSQSGSYRVGVTMAVCRQNPCWYGAAVSGQ